LGISPSFVRITNTPNTNNQNRPLTQKNLHKDMWELSLVKTVLEHPKFIDQVLDVLDPSLLAFHAREFSQALHGDKNAPELMAIMVDDSITSLKDEESLKQELLIFLTKYYEKELKKINTQASISFEEKAFLIRKLRGKIATLRKGELVAF
jgi:DNA primase